MVAATSFSEEAKGSGAEETATDWSEGLAGVSDCGQRPDNGFTAALISREMRFQGTLVLAQSRVGGISEEALDNLEWLKNNSLGDIFLYISFSMRAHYYTVNATLDAAMKDASVPQAEAYFHLFKPCRYFYAFGYQGNLHPIEVTSCSTGAYLTSPSLKGTATAELGEGRNDILELV
ncbi:hypothetical protein HPB51_001608 [Rhipicephalus microplus]|uniref:Uncharacterized protein n=1 Tax=Rhipicephalus microplus TaxID=6941 RepID=A0A9J6EQC0_RHIMP|nr:hypothetical protein HPB51_001608 [Rhipicephalus microplus]